MTLADKACPVVFRDSSMRHILAFEHPRAGLQIVKGRIEPGEAAPAAALRELAEESGIANTAIARALGVWHSAHKGHIWSLQLCTFAPALPESWTHYCEDDGGVDFRFFWHDLADQPSDRWRPQYRRALDEIRQRTRPLRWRG